MAAYMDYQAIYCKRPVKVRTWSAAFFAGLFLFVVLATKVAFKMHSTSLGYKLAEVRKETIDLDTERREVELQRSVLLTPITLEERALKHLDLEPYSQVKVVKLMVEG